MTNPYPLELDDETQAELIDIANDTNHDGCELAKYLLNRAGVDNPNGGEW